MKYAILLIANISVILSLIAEYNPDWWKIIVLEPTPTNDLRQAAARLNGQQETVWLLAHADFSFYNLASSTNIWRKLAILHGDLREKMVCELPAVVKRISEIDYAKGQNPIVLSNITEQIAAIQLTFTDPEEFKSEYRRILQEYGIIRDAATIQRLVQENEQAKSIREYQRQRSGLESRIELVMGKIASSEALASFPIQERNAIVSNIVELARLTTDEAAELGLTNVVESVGE